MYYKRQKVALLIVTNNDTPQCTDSERLSLKARLGMVYMRLLHIQYLLTIAIKKNIYIKRENKKKVHRRRVQYVGVSFFQCLQGLQSVCRRRSATRRGVPYVGVSLKRRLSKGLNNLPIGLNTEISPVTPVNTEKSPAHSEIRRVWVIVAFYKNF